MAQRHARGAQIVDTPFDVSVTSPLLTLLMLSTHLDPISTALLIYEFTGSFSFYSPNIKMDDAIYQSVIQSEFQRLDSWQCITDTQGKPSGFGGLPDRPFA
ncbi:MAG: hypothetical protein ACLTSX_02740 [Collinsella sp.]